MQQSGITGDDRDLFRRKKAFGENARQEQTRASILNSVQQQMKDKTWFVIYACALLLTVMEVIVMGWHAITEGLSIIIGTTLIILILSFSDYQKDKRFLAIQNLLKESKVTVIRGKFQQQVSLSIWELVVGDVVLLSIGDKVPADCLVLEKSGLEVQIPEHLRVGNDLVDGFDKPFDERILFAETHIKRGKCKALVCCVGTNSSRPPKEVR
jgi:magnesium-transporting ATPase (P-type)